MTMKLSDLIRAVRACKTAADERATIAKESAAIRTSFKEELGEYRQRNVAKLLFIHMLGYPTHFGQMESVKLIASHKFAEKRIGYLALMLLLDERAELLTLVVNSLQQFVPLYTPVTEGVTLEFRCNDVRRDMKSKNQYVAGLALTTLGNIGSLEMIRDLAADLESCLQSPNAYIQKKAALCAIRVFNKVPDMIPDFLPRIAGLLSDKSHSVLLTGLTLMVEVCNIMPALVPRFNKMVPGLVKLLRKLVMSPTVPEYDIGGVVDPFLQAKILQMLRVLGKGDPAASEAMNTLLAQVATSTDANKNAGNAILYETVQTIMNVESESGLRVLAVNILGRFLINKDNNIRYVALRTLCSIVGEDTSAVQRHKGTIVECLKDPDISIRKRALVLVTALVNADNVDYLVGEMISYLAIADEDTKPDLCDRIGKAAATFAPSRKWHIDTLIRVLAIAGSADVSGIAASVLILISQTPEMYGYVAHKLYSLVEDDTSQLPLVHVAVWCIGEYGELLLTSPSEPDAGKPRTETEVMNLLIKITRMFNATADTKSRVLAAMLKLTTRFSTPIEQARIRFMLNSFNTSVDLELQQRSVEFTGVAQSLAPEVRAVVVERMPIVDASALHNPRDNADVSTEQAMAVSTGIGGKSGGGDGSSLLASPAAPPPAAATTSALVDLDDIFGAPSTSPPPGSVPAFSASVPKPAAAVAPPAAAVTTSSLLDDLFGAPPVAPVPAPVPAPFSTAGLASLYSTPQMPGVPIPRPAAPEVDVFGGFSGAAPVLPAAGSYAPIVAYEGGGLKMMFNFAKPGGPASDSSDIIVSVTNSTPLPFTNFQFQAAVPKYLKFTIDAPSGTTVPPNNSGFVTQTVHVTNTQHGLKPVMLKVKLLYTVNGESKVEQINVAGIPPNL